MARQAVKCAANSNGDAFFARIYFSHPIKQPGEMMGDGGINLIDQVGFLFFVGTNCRFL
jgi:hypothetical protein